MCGVAGIFHYHDRRKPVDRNALVRMTRVLRHRGPDDEGFFVDGAIGLGHRRLAIVDLSETGHQPMKSARGSVIAYNGETYNHREFRGRLEAKGVSFRGTSDTETVLHLVDAYGPGILADLAGIFAFALWDARHDRLILARDPLGVKQMYFHDDGHRIVFGSEIKALLEHEDVPRRIDPQGVNDYLHFHTPLFDRTFFAGIRQVRAGEYVIVDRHGARAKRYWQPEGFDPAPDSPEERVERLRALLKTVLRDQLMSDVPVGAFFSGGIDSTAVASYAKDAGARPRCFGVHFTDQGVIDERPFQEAAAKALGLELELTTLDGSTFPEDLRKLMYFQDQPVVGAAMLPMFYVSALAAKTVKVCLGGQAADEIFGGYARYALAEPMLALRGFVAARRRSRGTSDGQAVGGNLRKQLFDAHNLVRLVERVPQLYNWRRRYFAHFAKVPERRWARLFTDRSFFRRDRAYEQFTAGLNESPARRPIDKALDWDRRTYLTALFHQDDRMSMANSLESRVPLADPRMVQFALHTPAEMKLNDGATKWILRSAVADRIPEQVLNRRKVGFDTPIPSWLRRNRGEFLHDTFRSARSRDIFRATEIDGLVREWDGSTGKLPDVLDIVWKLLSVELWAQVFVDSRGAQFRAA